MPKGRRVARQQSAATLRPGRNLCALVAVAALVLAASASTGVMSGPAVALTPIQRSRTVKSAGDARFPATPPVSSASDQTGCADPGPVTDHGGPVETDPRVYVDFWGWRSDPNGEGPYLLSFLSSVGGSPWLSTVSQYCVDDDPRLAGDWDDVGTHPPDQPTDGEIQAEGRAAARYFGIEAVPVSSDPNVQIVVALPSDASLPQSNNEDCAYHERLESAAGARTDRSVVLTALPYLPARSFGTQCGAYSVNTGRRGVLDGVSIAEGHELVESLTDPEGNAWHDNDHPANEIADRCATQTDYDIDAGSETFAVQQLWSNAADRCVVVGSPPGTPNDVRAVGVDGHIDVSWDAPESTGGTPIIRWTVTATPGSSSCAVPAEQTSCVLAGVRNGTIYTIAVRASNAAGTSAPSPVGQAVPSSAQNCSFVGPYADLQGCSLDRGSLVGADLNGADLADSHLFGADLAGADLSGSDLNGADLRNATLITTDLFGADLAGADLSGSDLQGCDLTSSTLAEALLSGSDLTGVSSSGIIGSPSALPAHWSLVSGYLVGPGANLEDAELSFADLAGTDLVGADMIYADLISADVSHADLDGADLFGANVSDADLRGADVAHAELATANPFELLCPDGTYSSQDGGGCGRIT